MRGTPDINLWLKQNPRSCQYGAPMGRAQLWQALFPARWYCQRIRYIDGDYSADGTYWGGGSPLFAVFDYEVRTLCFYRAKDRREALAAFAIEQAEQIRNHKGIT